MGITLKLINYDKPMVSIFLRHFLAGCFRCDSCRYKISKRYLTVVQESVWDLSNVNMNTE